ncbi:hypothetical protein MmiEs2_02070 [Methanimicrococcus stummii]|uniref:Uncharacterized protein n=1 Tax=Methanimicrococcus stummii TaxID=3028294 RepID=A0AA96ZYD4_9EURY|nr:hypothetical protein [Methanimicrococcus sp. Es2]WNY28027.1 hypothetical protein MmiEs2_02070 [Methanimicrococcus sp. Es2]
MVTEISQFDLSLPSDSLPLHEISRLLTEMSDSVSYCLNGFISPDPSLILRRPLELNFRYEDELYIIENAVFNLFSFSENLETAVLEIEQHFSFLWEEYVLEDEQRLAPESIRLKKLLTEYLESRECSQKHTKQGISNPRF